MGQAMHAEVSLAILRHVSSLMGWGDRTALTPVRYVSLFSGIDVFAAAMEELFGDSWKFVGAIEAAPLVQLALKEAWLSKGVQILGDAFSTEVRLALTRHAGTVDLLVGCWRCAPWSQANSISLESTERRRMVQGALEEIQSQLELVGLVGPAVVVLECVTDLLRPCFRREWACIQGWLEKMSAWQWSFQSICPRRMNRSWWPRKRLWVIGLPASLHLE